MIQSIVKWIVFSNLWVSLSVAGFTFYGDLVGVFQVDSWYVFLAFFATLFAYNFQRLLKTKETQNNPSERHIWIGKNQDVIKVFSIVSGVICLLISMVFIPLRLYWMLIPMVGLVLLYAGKNVFKIKSLREYPFFKIFAISLCWSFVVAILPALLDPFKEIDGLYACSCFLLTFVLCIPFDIRDIENDKGKLITIPIAVGVQNAKYIAAILLFILILFGIFYQWYEWVFVAVCSMLVVFCTNQDRKELFFAGLVDGIFILLPLLTMVLR